MIFTIRARSVPVATGMALVLHDVKDLRLKVRAKRFVSSWKPS